MHAVENSRELAWLRSRLAAALEVDEQVAVVATNLQGLVARWNTGAERLYGWSEDEALGRDILDLTPAKYTRDQAAQIMSALQAGETWQGEILLRRRDGAPLLAFVIDIPVGDFAIGQGAIVGISAPAESAARVQDQAAQIRPALARCFEAS